MGKEGKSLLTRSIISALLLIAAGILAERGVQVIGHNVLSGLAFLGLAIVAVVASIMTAKPSYQILDQTVIASKLAFTKAKNIANQRIIKLHESLDGLWFDVRTKRMGETEFHTIEYQTRVKDCRKLASKTGNRMAVARASAILNLMHLYVRRIQQVRKEAADVDFSMEVEDTTFSMKINTELGLLLNEVQNE
jgi:hypothetical protein